MDDGLTQERVLDGAGWHRNDTGNFRRLGRIQQYGGVFARLVLLADGAVLYCGLFFSTRLLGLTWTQRGVTLALLSIVVFAVAVSCRQLNHTWRLASLGVELSELLCLLSVSFAIVLGVLVVETRWIEDSRNLELFGAWFAMSLAGMALVRALSRMALQVYRFGPADHRQVAFVGVTQTAMRLAEVFRKHPWMGVDVVGFYRASEADAAIAPARGGLADLLALARSGGVSAIYIAPANNEIAIKQVVDTFADTLVSVYYCPPLLDLNLLNACWDDVFGHPVVSIMASPFDGWGRHLKRLEDLVLASLILPMIAPVLLLVAAAVRLTSPGPVLYSQSRHGLNGKPFRILKFRTMFTVDADHEFVQARRNDSRITPFGSFLRRTSLDELPQFINVLRGEMSVVGPRPAPLKYNDDHRQLIHRYMIRHKVKPGITGLAQVSGARGQTETVAKTEERTALDLDYINNWSLWLDLRILLRTVGMMLTELSPR